jgi:hypothetical protein
MLWRMLNGLISNTVVCPVLFVPCYSYVLFVKKLEAYGETVLGVVAEG